MTEERRWTYTCCWTDHSNGCPLEIRQQIVSVGRQSRAGHLPFAQERDRQINKAMSKLYDEGCRRMRTVKLPITGDYTRFKVMGWQ